MGCLIVIVLGAISAALIFSFGYADWLLITLGLIWIVSIILSLLKGHQGFGGRGNTDAQIVIAALFIATAVILPDFVSRKHCDQARKALSALAEAEEKYRAEHKTYTARLDILNLTTSPNVQIDLTKADEKSFTASASHRTCNKEGSPEIFIWDSSRGGLQ
jgi:hypothetical protein